MTSDDDKLNQTSIFEIKPNSSLSREGVVIFYIAVVFVSILLTVRFWLLGAWLVMPFFALEMIVLGISLYLLVRSSKYREIIEITSDYVSVIAKRGEQLLWTDHFNRHWVEVVLDKNNKNWYPSELYLRSHGRSVRIGKCLTDEDRVGLAKSLKLALNKYKAV